MSSKTKIMVVKRREIIYTVIFLALIILLIVLMITMFRSKPSDKQNTAPKTAQTSTQTSTQIATQSATQSDTAQYIAGIYTTPITLGDSAVDVEVIVDENHINSIRLVNLSEAATAMYPLVSPALNGIAGQICERQSLENITCPEDNKYTSQLLLNAISQALENAKYVNWQ